MSTPARFPAFRIRNDEAGYRSGIEQVSLDELSAGEVVIQVAWSSVNYKDALAGTGKGRILRNFPLVGGIDVAGHVVASTDPAFREGDAVLVTGCGLSETRDGGYAAYARLPAEWVVALPRGLDLRESMILGTAGFTAALALYRMHENRQRPELGPLAVTGATGGVGSLAVAIFSRPATRCTRSAASPNRPAISNRSAPARCLAAMRWRPGVRWSRCASAVAWTMSADRC